MLGLAIILRPVVNEKSIHLIKQNKYTFEVDPNSNKDQIAKAVAAKFGVTVLGVSTLNKKGKVKMQKSRRLEFQAATIKRAIVEVKKGDRIAIFESPKEDKVEVTTAENLESKKEVEKKESASKKQISTASKTKGEK